MKGSPYDPTHCLYALLISCRSRSNDLCRSRADRDICSALAAEAEMADLETLFPNLMPVSRVFVIRLTGGAKSPVILRVEGAGDAAGCRRGSRIRSRSVTPVYLSRTWGVVRARDLYSGKVNEGWIKSQKKSGRR